MYVRVVEECNGSSEGIRTMQKKDYTRILLHICMTKVLISYQPCMYAFYSVLFVHL